MLAVAMRVCVCLLLAAASAGVAHAGARPSTRVTILAVNPNVGRALFHLSCGPAGGDVPAPKRACTALASDPELVLRPHPFVCHGGPSSWWDITVSGRLGHRAFRSHTSSCWTPQMALIGRLGIGRSLAAHLLPRRRQGLFGGQQRTFRAGMLRPGDLVVCDTHGRHLENGVPLAGTSETGFDGVGVARVRLRVTRHSDGSVTASCT